MRKHVSTRAVALIAHDKQKGAMLDFARAHRAVLVRYPLIAIATTGKLLTTELGRGTRPFVDRGCLTGSPCKGGPR